MICFLGQVDKVAHAYTSTCVPVPLHHIFGFGRCPSPPGCSDNCRGRKWACPAHTNHHWPPRDVQEEVIALGITLGARQDPYHG